MSISEGLPADLKIRKVTFAVDREKPFLLLATHCAQLHSVSLAAGQLVRISNRERFTTPLQSSPGKKWEAAASRMELSLCSTSSV
jgi:hypothetical protein